MQPLTTASSVRGICSVLDLDLSLLLILNGDLIYLMSSFISKGRSYELALTSCYRKGG